MVDPPRPADSAGEAAPLSTGTGTQSQDMASKSSSQPTNPQPNQSVRSLVALLTSILLAIFIVGLDRTIIATAMPRITDDFNSFSDIGWYRGSYLLTSCALQLLYGKSYTIFSIKWVLLANVLFFEAASALCGAAPNSATIIIGRAFMGIGAAGITAGVLICIAYTVPLSKRSLVQALFGALMGVAAIAGPLIGDALTSNVTWRWCFYINLPVGAPLREKLKQLDVLGTTLLVPGVICLLLALQWGGQTYAWNNGRIIALLTIAGVLLIGFVVSQIVRPATATVPTCILKQRSVAAAFWITFMFNCGSYIISSTLYFLPIWFQAIQGVSASKSGVQILPVMISTIIGTIGGGFINLAIGYYTPLAIAGACVMSVGSGLLTTLQLDSGIGNWFGYQVPNFAAQTVLPQDDVPTGLALMMFRSLIGASVYVPISQNVLGNILVQKLSWIPGFDPSLVTSGGVTSLIRSLPDTLRETPRVEYNGALRKVFLIGVVPNCLSVIGTEKNGEISVEDDESAEEENTGKTELQTYDRIAKHHGFNGQGKTILITGGATGVRFSIAKAFAGADVARIAIISRSCGQQETARAALEGAYPSTEIITYEASVTEGFRTGQIFHELGTVDVLVLSAAVAHRRAPGIEISEQDVRDAFEINVIATFNLTKTYLAMPQPVGSVKTLINISSAATQVCGMRVGYGPSKAAAAQMMQHFAAEEKSEKVRIFSLHSGALYTPGTARVFSKDAIAWEDINLPAHFALWLAGPESSSLHGRYVCAQWDVDELIALNDKLAQDVFILKIGLVL
ncbi:major facilitator superfamily transporter aflatoxin efflux [Corynascus novoguineensis]|uniref:Major facilitator superfamily transporter aflatoxin efflux n=1 Tax=Corynascus novoguineensis TaxID=1126955 RepID=A0AAN7HG57_9PEZI|nr:major facilitator superfamily transporter aflatoxin efflux [Corynascus novoguineensis]